jgi:hypothetical protein
MKEDIFQAPTTSKPFQFCPNIWRRPMYDKVAKGEDVKRLRELAQLMKSDLIPTKEVRLEIAFLLDGLANIVEMLKH